MTSNCGTGVQQGLAPYNGQQAMATATPSSSSAQPLKHDPGLSLEWTADEQSILEDGLAKFANETNILRYIKIAALLRDKTVRDVALRCRWMSKKENGKRRKAEDQSASKKMKDRKEKHVDPSSKQAASLGQRPNLSGYLPSISSTDDDKALSFEEIGGTTGRLLEQNAQAFEQITANLASYRIQENIALLCRTRDNIVAILNDMKDMPGVMSQMPPLPVTIDETLACRILPPQSQGIVLDGSNMHLKQELR